MAVLTRCVTLLTLMPLVLPAGAHAIARGTDAPAGAQPWFASLLRQRTGNARLDFRCGGTLIGPDRVLTAAHCVDGLTPRQLRVLLGRDRLSVRAGIAARVRGVSVLRTYRLIPAPAKLPGTEATDDDLALVLLTDRVDGVTPLALAPATPAAGSAVTLLGQGRTANGPEGEPNAIRSTPGVVLSAADCRDDYGDLLRPGNICTLDPDGERDAHPCSGDSGSPVLVPQNPPLLAAVHVWGSETKGGTCGDRPEPDVSADVNAHRAFVTQRDPPLAPIDLAPPRILATRATLRCAHGRWRGERIRFAYRWTRRRRVIARHATIARPRSGAVRCAVTATTAGGSVTRATAALPAR